MAKMTLKKYRPEIICITGGVGKTSAKEAIFSVLKSHKKTRVSFENEDAEFSVLMAVLGGTKKSSGIFFALILAISSVYRLLFKSSYPEILILDFGGGEEKNFKKILSFLRPDIAVVTSIGDIPPFIESFSGPEQSLREKAKIVEHLSSSGFAILSGDDPVVMKMIDRTRGKVMTFGFGKKSNVLLTNFEHRENGGFPFGISFKIGDRETFVPVRLEGVFGKTHAYAAGAAAAVGLILGINLVKISEALVSSYLPEKGRSRLVKGIKDSLILDDSYESSPLSLSASLSALKSIPAKRRIAFLGDMSCLGRYSIEAHEESGRLAASLAKIIITVGSRSKFIAESGIKSGLFKKSVLSFDNVEEAGKKLQDILRKGDVVLIKGSKEMKMEKAVEEVMADPEKSDTLILKR